ncbi:putative gustatory receptor 59f [Drosophila novamexicana]|uniref:putative gustatory receptor 59f n=1 Tax=Drosophila novamexicana TaxID=47314 RepID=UPI0011E5ED61|nr:putative gustatory receptor 59f [Drosophila novamexicana]
MLQLKLKQAAREKRLTAAWSQPQQGSTTTWKQQRNWNLTQQLYKSNAEQLHQELRLLLLICVLAGSAPLAVFPRCSSRVHAAVQHAWLLALYIWLCCAAYLELADGSQERNNLERNFYIFESVTYLIHIPCIMILSMRWKRRIAGVFQAIGEFDLVCGYIVDRRGIRRFVRHQLWLLLIFASCCIPIVLSHRDYEVCKSLVNLSTYVLPNILSAISFVLYYSLLQGISLRLHRLANALQLELQRGPSTRRAELQKLRGQHTRLLHFTKRVNQTFGVSVLLLYVSSLINFNTNLFLVYKAIEKPGKADWPWLAYTILWLLMHTGKMFFILYFNHNVQQQQAHCAALLSKVSAADEDLLETINHFALQLQGNVRAHVACGLFELDYKLIPALLMTTANLFIFLLQYDITFQALARAINITAF